MRVRRLTASAVLLATCFPLLAASMPSKVDGSVAGASIATQKPRMPSDSELGAMSLAELQHLQAELLFYAKNKKSGNELSNWAKVHELMLKKARKEYFPGFNGTSYDQHSAPTDTLTMELVGPQNITQVLQDAKEEFVLMVFTIPGCHACSAQKRTLAEFHAQHGWQVREINALEHLPLAEKFNVRSVPTTLAIHNKTSQWCQLCSGMTPLPTMEKKALSVMDYMGKTI